MHRVLNLQSIGKDATVISNHKSEIQVIRDRFIDDLHSSQVNDGTNEDGNPTLGVGMDFNNATQGNAFHEELKQYIRDNSGDFSFARTRVHDCNHAADKNEPCKIGDMWKL